jgi:aryl-alcohol dehydrogenase-like predicted oxidoreductase
MEYRRLGRTGVEVSAQALGTMMFGPRGNEDEAQCIAMLHRALDAGINLIDTADSYDQGASESVVGKATQGHRDEIFLATKVFNQMGEGRNRHGGSRYWIQKEVEASLRRLDTDHIDLYQLHRPDPTTDLEDTVDVLTDLVRQGKIRYWGTSTFPGIKLVEALWIADRRSLSRPSCEQPPYSILVRQIERDVLPVTQQHGMGVISWGPLNGGFLTGKYRQGSRPADSRAERFLALGRHTAARFDGTRVDVKAKHDAVDRLSVIAEEAGLTLIELALGFVMAHPGITSTIIGPRTPEQLETFLAAADLRLDDTTLDAIDEVVPPATTLAQPDRGWNEPWMRPAARRR